MPQDKVEVICFGEIYWGPCFDQLQLMGFPLNFAYHCRKMGFHTELVTSVGADQLGKNAVNNIDSLEISTQFIKIDFEIATSRIDGNRVHDRIVLENFDEPAPWDNLPFDPELESLLNSSTYVAFSNSVLRRNQTWNTFLHFKHCPAKKILDFRYRSLQITKPVIEELLSGLFHLTIRYEELEFLTGWLTHHSSLTDRLDLLHDRFHIPSVLLIMHDGSIAWKYLGHTFFRKTEYQIKDQDHDCCEALAAAILKGIHNKQSSQVIFDRAISLFNLILQEEIVRSNYDVYPIEPT